MKDTRETTPIKQRVAVAVAGAMIGNGEFYRRMLGPSARQMRAIVRLPVSGLVAVQWGGPWTLVCSLWVWRLCRPGSSAHSYSLPIRSASCSVVMPLKSSSIANTYLVTIHHTYQLFNRPLGETLFETTAILQEQPFNFFFSFFSRPPNRFTRRE